MIIRTHHLHAIVHTNQKFPKLAPLAFFSMLVILIGGCTPQLRRFNVTIPSNLSSTAQSVAAHRGTTHICPGTLVQLSWDVAGKASLTAGKGQIYQPPACFSASRIPAKGSQVFPATPEIAAACGDTAILRLTSSHNLWRRAGYCPGPGCPGADHEIVTRSETDENVGGKTDGCSGSGIEVTNIKAGEDWDDHYRVGKISVPAGINDFLRASGRTLTVFHEGKKAVFTGEVTSSDLFQGEKFPGTWKLRLSNCDQSPSALTVNVLLMCNRKEGEPSGNSK